MLSRVLNLATPPQESFLLWGPRQAGKTSLLRATWPKARLIDLLLTEEYVRYLQRPGLLRDELRDAASGTLTLVDEIQKVPALLDEIHWLIENRALHFGMCGSSARKLRRGHANLLGGRAIRHELFGLVSAEIGPSFDLTRMVNHGYLPRHYLANDPGRRLRAYVDDYLKEEIAAEGLIRNVPAFASYLSAASLSDTELVNFTTIARECGVSANTVKEYFQIMVDTLMGRFLPAYVKRPKRRVIQSPKFYFADVGVVNHLAKRGRVVPGSELFGKALENLIHHELTAYREYRNPGWELSYWRLASGIEVDFVVGDLELAVEVKSSERIGDDHLTGLRAIKADHRNVGRRVLVCRESRRRVTADGIEILPVRDFLERLWQGELAQQPKGLVTSE
jgi:predicted AAA+ superfamily ATPase